MGELLHRVQGFLTVACSVAGDGVAVGEGGCGGGGVGLGGGGGGVAGNDAVSAPSETSPSSSGMVPIRSESAPL
jgi:hypothetical protein